MIKKLLINYAARHRNPVNRLLHLIGLPVTFLLPIYLLGQNALFYAVISFIGGYALQFLGHAVEGNDAGEICLIKRWLGRPYVAIARMKPSPQQDACER